MKLFKFLILICFSFLAGCSDLDEPSVQEPIDERLILLRNIIRGPLATPVGKLKSESFYYGPETLQYRTDFYYDAEGRDFLRIRIQDGDTTGIYLNEYLDNGKLDQTGVYFAESDGFTFSHYFKWFYENAGQKIKVMSGKDGNFSQYEEYYFDDFDRKISYRRGTDIAFSLHKYIYENEQSQQITEEHYFESGSTDLLYRYRYDYSEKGLLQAKFLSFFVEFNRTEFEYFYDDKKRLSEEVKNDIRFLSGPIERKTYEYY